MCLHCNSIVAAKEGAEPSFIFQSCSDYCLIITNWMLCHNMQTETEIM